MTNRTSIMAVAAVVAIGSLTACTEADRVSQNVSTEAENFNVTRRLAVINTITDKPQLELIGNFSIEVDSEGSQLEITVKVDENRFKKHFVGLTPTAGRAMSSVDELSTVAAAPGGSSATGR